MSQVVNSRMHFNMTRKPVQILIFTLLAGSLLSGLFFSCSKSSNSLTGPYIAAGHDAIDTVAINKFLAANTMLDTIHLKVVKSDSTQLRYMIMTPVRGDSSHNSKPTRDSAVVFNYSLRVLKNGKAGPIIDSVGAPGYRVSPLKETLTCFTEALQRIPRGYRILLFVPSSLGFRDNPTDVTYNRLSGAQQITIVPANSVLIFDVTLTGVQKL